MKYINYLSKIGPKKIVAIVTLFVFSIIYKPFLLFLLLIAIIVLFMKWSKTLVDKKIAVKWLQFYLGAFLLLFMISWDIFFSFLACGILIIPLLTWFSIKFFDNRKNIVFLISIIWIIILWMTSVTLVIKDNEPLAAIFVSLITFSMLMYLYIDRNTKWTIEVIYIAMLWFISILWTLWSINLMGILFENYWFFNL
jgi:hypothetical protein